MACRDASTLRAICASAKERAGWSRGRAGTSTTSQSSQARGRHRRSAGALVEGSRRPPRDGTPSKDPTSNSHSHRRQHRRRHRNESYWRPISLRASGCGPLRETAALRWSWWIRSPCCGTCGPGRDNGCLALRRYATSHSRRTSRRGLPDGDTTPAFCRRAGADTVICAWLRSVG